MTTTDNNNTTADDPPEASAQPPPAATPIDTSRTMIAVTTVVTSPPEVAAAGSKQQQPSRISNIVHPEVAEEDEIGVTLDYEFPTHTNYEEADAGAATDGESRRSRTQQRDRRRRRRRRRERVGFFEFYRKHWFGQFASGIFTGLIFLVIGLVFIIVFNDLPTYIGVLFILVSFPPCCLSVNRLRHARAAERLRRENLSRLRALRRMHRQNRAADGTAGDRHLPFADLPPAYNNLGFVGNEAELETGEIRSRASSMTSSLSETDLPSYEEAIRVKQEIEEELARERENDQQQQQQQRERVGEIFHPRGVASSSHQHQMVDEIRASDDDDDETGSSGGSSSTTDSTNHR